MGDLALTIELAREEAMAGVPEFLDIPQDMQDKIAAATVAKERYFWLATKITKTPVTEALIRRAIYAEQRVLETEYMLGEMAVICKGAKQRVEELQKQLDETVRETT